VGEVGNITANHNSSNDENINNEENLGFEWNFYNNIIYLLLKCII
jgi:hypothetical protein